MNKKRGGFTLSEMIISVAILSAVTIYILQMLIATKNINIKSYEIDQSVRISKNIISLLSSGEEISQKSKYKIISNMKYIDGYYVLNFDKNFEITTPQKSLYALNLKSDKNDGINNISINITRLQPYIMNNNSDLSILDLTSSQMY